MADPSLIHSNGHSGRYLLALAGELAKEGIENHLVGNIQVSAGAAGIRSVLAYFSLTCEDARLPRADFAFATQPHDQWRRHSASIVDGFNAIDDEFGFLPSDVVLLNTVRQWSLPGVIDWLETRPTSRCPQIAIILHYSPWPTKDVANPTSAEYQIALGRISRSSRSSHVLLFADSNELVREFETLSNVPVQVVPIPHVGDIDRCEAPKNGIRIVAAGPARANKGFHQLPSILKALKLSGGRGQFVVQGFSFHHDYAMSRVVTELTLGGAEVLPDELADSEFRRLVGTADLIVLPYVSEAYNSQTSGVFAEALGAGIPVIVPEGTWMARQIATFGGGMAYDGSAQGLEDACLGAINDIEQLKSAAKDARERWLHEHGPRQFLSHVSGRLDAIYRDPELNYQSKAA